MFGYGEIITRLILTNVGVNLSMPDVAKLSLASKESHSFFANDEVFWQAKLKKDFQITDKELKELIKQYKQKYPAFTADYKAIYIKCYKGKKRINSWFGAVYFDLRVGLNSIDMVKCVLNLPEICPTSQKLQWFLFALTIDSDDIAQQLFRHVITSSKLLALVAKTGNLSFVQLLVAPPFNLKPTLGILHYAVRSGKLALVKWLFEPEQQQFGLKPTPETLNYAVMSGSLAVVVWLLEEQRFGLKPTMETLNFAACSGSLDTMKYLLAPTQQQFGLKPTFETLHSAIKSDNFAMVRWLLEEQTFGLQPTLETLKTIAHGHIGFSAVNRLAMAQWLLDPQRSFNLQLDTSVCDAMLNYFPIAEWLFSLPDFAEKLLQTNQDPKLLILMSAIRCEQFAVVREWLEKYPDLVQQFPEQILEQVIFSGCLELVQWLFDPKRGVKFKLNDGMWIKASHNSVRLKCLVDSVQMSLIQDDSSDAFKPLINLFTTEYKRLEADAAPADCFDALCTQFSKASVGSESIVKAWPSHALKQAFVKVDLECAKWLLERKEVLGLMLDDDMLDKAIRSENFEAVRLLLDPKYGYHLTELGNFCFPEYNREIGRFFIERLLDSLKTKDINYYLAALDDKEPQTMAIVKDFLDTFLNEIILSSSFVKQFLPPLVGYFVAECASRRLISFKDDEIDGLYRLAIADWQQETDMENPQNKQQLELMQQRHDSFKVFHFTSFRLG